MTPGQARAVLSSAFASNWGGMTPVSYDNSLPPTPGNAWVRLTILHADNRLQSWSGDAQNYRVTGIACVHVFTRLGTGTQQSDQLASFAKGILQGKQFTGGVETYESRIVEDGDDGHGWWQVRVMTRFTYGE